MKGMDCAEPVGDKAKELRASGIDFVCRYYSHNTAKNLTRTETQQLSDAGLLIVSVWEARGDRDESFGHAQGAQDASAAIIEALACGQPKGTPIYFAVDFDATQGEIDSDISDYFDAVRGTLNGAYLVGSYGSPLVNASLAAKGLATRSWRAQSTGWSGDHSQPADILQGPEGKLLSIDIDTDSTTEAADRIGAWSLSQSPQPQPGPQPLNVEQAVRRLQAALYVDTDGVPGTETIAALRKYAGIEPAMDAVQQALGMTVELPPWTMTIAALQRWQRLR